MNETNDILIQLYERKIEVERCFKNNEIDQFEHDILTEKVDLRIEEEIYLEGVIEDLIASHGVNEFKKRYNFVPLKNHKNIGYATINGRKTRVDLNINNPVAKIGKTYQPRQLSAALDEKNRHIIVDKNYATMLGKKKRKALIDHEDGHFHFDNIHTADKNKRHRSTLDNVIGNGMASIGFDKNDKDLTKSFRRECQDKYKDFLKDATKDPKDKKMRNDLENKTKKYITKDADNGHSSTSEIKADAWSANINGPQVVKKAIASAQKKGLSKKGTIDSIYKSLVSADYNNPTRLKNIKKMSSEDRERYKKKRYSDATKQYNDLIKNYSPEVNGTIQKTKNEIRNRKNALDDKSIYNHTLMKK